MQLIVHAEWSDYVSVEIDREQLVAEVCASLEPDGNWLRLLNKVAFVLKALPDTTIAGWTPGQRQTIHAFLAAQTPRFAEGVAQE